MKSPPKFLRGAYRSAIRVALTEADLGYAARDELRVTRSWKLFLLLPRMLHHKPARGVDPQRQGEGEVQFVLAGPLGGSDPRQTAM